MSPLLGEIKRGGETILSSPVGEGWKGWGTLNRIPPKFDERPRADTKALAACTRELGGKGGRI